MPRHPGRFAPASAISLKRLSTLQLRRQFYLPFIKRLDELHTLKESKAARVGSCIFKALKPVQELEGMTG
jgi:hypothetical protein